MAGVENRLNAHQSESAVLGAVLMDGCVNERYSILLRISEILQPSDFWELKHRDIYQAMLDLFRKSIPVDYITLCDALEEKNRLGAVGGVSYIAGLTDGEYSMTNIEYYAAMVRRHAARRQIESAVAESTKAIRDGEATADVIETIQARLRAPLEVLDRQADPEAGVQSMRLVSGRAFERLSRIQDGQGDFEVFTGYEPIDLFYAPKPGNLVVIGARTGIGKTALALGIAANMATRNDPVYFVSREMPMVDIAFRLISRLSDVNMAKFGRKGGLTDPEWGRISQGINRCYGLPFYISRHGKPAEITSVARQLVKSSEPISAVFIDYLGLLDLPKADRHDLRLEAAVKEFTNLAKETGLVVYLLVQINREGDYDKGSGKPRLSQLKGSGSIEQAADLVYLLHRPGYQKANRPDDELAVRIAKHRQGPTGEISLAWKAGHVLNERVNHGH